MRLWSLHPSYLDQSRLCGQWREAIMARNALEGPEHGYRNHSALERFKDNPTRWTGKGLVNSYLCDIYRESQKRGYNFDPKRLGYPSDPKQLPVTKCQLKFERQHLLDKLLEKFIEIMNKDLDDTEKKVKRLVGIAKRHKMLLDDGQPKPHPLFYPVSGPKADWERG